MIPTSNHVVVYSVDKEYIWPFLISLFSAKFYAKREFRSVLAYSSKDLSDHDISLVDHAAKMIGVELEFLVLEPNQQEEVVNHVSKAAYNKFQVILRMKSEFIWIDSDTLFVKGWDDIFDFIHEPDESIVIKAVYEPTNLINLNRANEARLRTGNSYYNSGVMIIYPTAWLRLEFHRQWQEIARNRKELKFEFNDQDVFNYLTVGHTKPLPHEFNYFAKDLGEAEQYRTNVKKILHFTGPTKPWHYNILEQFFYRRLANLSTEFAIESIEIERFDTESHDLYWKLQSIFIALLQSTKLEWAEDLLSIHKNSFSRILDWKSKFKAQVLYYVFHLFLKPWRSNLKREGIEL